MLSNACPECVQHNRLIGLVDGGCRLGCPNLFRSSEVQEDLEDEILDFSTRVALEKARRDET